MVSESAILPLARLEAVDVAARTDPTRGRQRHDAGIRTNIDEDIIRLKQVPDGAQRVRFVGAGDEQRPRQLFVRENAN